MPAGFDAQQDDMDGISTRSRVTVVIATRNRRQELLRTLGRLAELPGRPPVIVVDNGSDDGSADAVRRRFPGVEVVVLARNAGAAARNEGVRRARTPYVAFSDDDSWWETGALARAAAAFDADPRLGLIAARTLIGPARRPDPVNAAMARSPLRDNGAAEVLGFLACACVVRRAAFLGIGGFSGLLFFIGEERLLAYDLAAAGWGRRYLPEAVAIHHPSRHRPDPGLRRRAELRNSVLTAWLRRPPEVMLAETMSLAGQAARDRDARAALAGALRRLPRALAARRRLPDDIERKIRILAGASRHDENRPRHRENIMASQPAADPRMTVVLITRDRRDELARALDRMTSVPERPPVIVVDNASSDGSAKAAGRYPGVRVITAGENLGAVARNLGVQQVATPYVAFCDDDTWWAPGALAKAADLLDRFPRLASVTGRILVEPEGTEDPLTPELRDSPIPAPSWLPGPALMSILAGASMLRVRAFEEVGGFSPRLWLGGEEELLGIDLAAAGWWMSWAADVIVHHAASAVRDPRQRRMLGIRNTLWTAWLRRPAGGALRRTVAVLRSVPRDTASAAAVGQAMAGLPWVIRERRVIPDHVEGWLRLLEAPQRVSPARRYVG